VDVSLLDVLQVVERIVNDNILILVNLDGHMPGMPPELSALLPAPVQISFLGFPGSLGSNYTDYIVADKVVIPRNLNIGNITRKKLFTCPIPTFPRTTQSFTKIYPVIQ